MKKRFACSLFVGVFLASEVMAVLPRHDHTLPDYDKRVEAEADRAAPGGAHAQKPLSIEQAQAKSLLESQVPGVRVGTDPLFQNPSSINAEHGFLTGSGGKGKAVSLEAFSQFSASDSNRVVKAFLNEHRNLLGVDADDLASAIMKSDRVTKHNGLRSVTWQQQYNELPVFEGTLAAHLTRDEELVQISSRFIPDPESAANAGNQNWKSLLSGSGVSAAGAVALAAADVGLSIDADSLTQMAAQDANQTRERFTGEGLFGPAYVERVWLPMSLNSMRICWQVVITVSEGPNRFEVLVDAESGEVQIRRDMSFLISPATYNVYTSDSPSPFSPGWPEPSSEQPPLVDRELITIDALSTNASPNGWINDGESTTKGNNADAFADLNLDLGPDRPRPQGGIDRMFDFPIDLNQPPATYIDASTVQLFYDANRYHDLVYELGFTEAAGNFQVENFGRGGVGDDPVLCLVHAGANVGEANNAFFSTSPDGIPGIMAMFLWNETVPNRDGSLDQEIVFHELTHGLSTRLLGGPEVGISALQTAGMGEGWSDFYSLSLLSEESDDINGNYAAGGYVTYELGGLVQNYYFGVRRYPYTTDLQRNPLTFKDIDPTQASVHFGIPVSPVFGGGPADEVHSQGEVWCAMLWEVRAALIEKWGWTIGNQMVLQLVTDGLKLAPANANFVQARNAIIMADEVDNGGENFAEIWIAFAKRGIGYSAQAPTSFTTVGVVEAYDVPPEVFTRIEDGLLEVRIVPGSSSALLSGEEVPVFVRVTDGPSVTNATVTASLSTGGDLPFSNDGVEPDLRANDGTYTGLLLVPTNADTVTITLVISAPEKDTSTNVVTYFIVQPPPNDNFANATKVPAQGASYLTTIKNASLEMDEPVHAGVASVTNSLWWSLTPTVNTNILIDTGGSDFRSVVAVYTNNTLVTLQPVASSVGSVSRVAAYVFLEAKASVNYRIVVAGYDSFNIGTLNLRIVPGGIPDTNAPVLTVTSPPSGVFVTSNRLFMVGSAVDPAPVRSGIRDIILNVSPQGSKTIVTPAQTLEGPASTNWMSIVGLIEGLNRIQAVATDFAGNRSKPVTIEAIYRPNEPVNDFFVNATALSSEDEPELINTSRATKEVNEPSHAGNAGGKSAWWSFVPVEDGVLTLNTTNSSFDTLLALYVGEPVGNLTLIASNDDAEGSAPGGFSMLSHAVRAGTNYHIAVDGFDGAGGAVFLTHSFVPETVFNLTVSGSAGGSVTPTSEDYAAGTTALITATPEEFFKFDGWEGSVVSKANPLMVTVNSNISLVANFSPIEFSDGFETGGFSGQDWTFAGDLPWVVQGDIKRAGSFSAKSGAIGHNQTSSLILSNEFNEGILSFSVRVSSEAGYDVLRLFIDDTLFQQWSGDTGWLDISIPISEGMHQLEWRYSKDAALSEGLDAAFLDNLVLPKEDAMVEPTPAILSISIQTDGSLLLGVQGQTNSQYVISGSLDLLTWRNLSTNTAANGVILYTDPGQSTNQMRFYRAIAP